ncbi:MAG: ABC transporter ATP-binding protein [Anaerolineales bacterium]|nr:ABC transporter ATP-binding protein [Anaerolineales bacterium]
MYFAIETQNLSRIYKIRGGKKTEPKELLALDDINIQIRNGELFGLLGPNGAGKTTLIKILTTLLAPSSGTAKVAGYDVSKEKEKVRPRINMVSGGESSGYGLLTVRENLWMFAQFYGIPSSLANQRIKELLEVVGLADRINSKSSDLSTGLRQKMNVVRGFLTDPDVLFLDEPTLGLDVGASREIRRFIRKWVDDDQTRTLLLTTHYMVEADELCDRVAIINQGRVLACDTPATLKHRLQGEAIFRIEVSPLNGANIHDFEAIPGVRKVTHRAHDGFSTMELILAQDDVLSSVVSTMTAENIHIQNLQKREPTLEDVFVDLVGKSIEDVESDDDIQDD